MVKKSQDLTELQTKACLLLVTGQSARAVANQLEIAEETISRWRKIESFESAINNLLEDARTEAKFRLTGLLDKSLGVVEEILSNPKIDSKIRFNAALKIISLVAIDADLAQEANTRRQSGQPDFWGLWNRS